MNRNRETIQNRTRNTRYKGSNEKETTCLPHPPLPAPHLTLVYQVFRREFDRTNLARGQLLPSPSCCCVYQTQNTNNHKYQIQYPKYQVHRPKSQKLWSNKLGQRATGATAAVVFSVNNSKKNIRFPSAVLDSWGYTWNKDKFWALKSFSWPFSPSLCNPQSSTTPPPCMCLLACLSFWGGKISL